MMRTVARRVLLPLAAAGWFTAGFAATILPDPASLQPGWWDSLISDDGGSDQRLAEFESAIESSAERVAGDALAAEVQEVLQALRAYRDWVAREPQPPPALPELREAYGIEALLELSREARRAATVHELEDAEFQQRQRLEEAQQQRLSAARVAYQTNDDDEAQHILGGWRVIKQRIGLAISGEQLRVSRVRLEQSRARREAFMQRLEAARQRFAAGTAEERILRERIGRLEAQRETLLSRVTTAGAPMSATIELLATAELAAVDLEISQQRLMLALVVEQLNGGEDIERVRALERQHHARLTSVLDQLPAWRAAADRQKEAFALASTEQAQSVNAQSAIERADRLLVRMTGLVRDGEFLEDLAGDRLRAETGWRGRLQTAFEESVSDLWATLRSLFSYSLFEINETPVTLLGLLRVSLILIIAWWLSRLVRHGLSRIGSRRRALSEASVYTLSRLVHYTFLFIGFIIGLSSIGLDFTKLALLLSAVGIGLGFGLQAIFSNFISGLIILFEKSLKVGDFVELASGVQGEVKEINIRSTLITTNDNVDILVPNSEFVTGRVVNWTLRDAQRRIRIPFGVAYGTDKDLVRKAALEAAAEVPYTLTEPERRRPQVWLVGFGDSSLDFELVVWLASAEAVKRPAAVQAQYTWAIETALGKYGIEIPFPQRDLHVRSMFGRKDHEGREWLDGVASPGGEQPG